MFFLISMSLGVVFDGHGHGSERAVAFWMTDFKDSKIQYACFSRVLLKHKLSKQKSIHLHVFFLYHTFRPFKKPKHTDYLFPASLMGHSSRRAMRSEDLSETTTTNMDGPGGAL